MGGLIEEKGQFSYAQFDHRQSMVQQNQFVQLAFQNYELKHVPGHYNLDALKTAQRIGRGFINEKGRLYILENNGHLIYIQDWDQAE